MRSPPPSALLQYSKFSYTAGAKISLKRLADELVQACKTKVEDRSKLRREFPIQFIALPWESDMNATSTSSCGDGVKSDIIHRS